MRRLPLEHPGTADHRSPGRFLLWIAKGQWLTLVGGAVFGILWMSSQAVMPFVIGRAIDRGVADQDGRALVTYAAVMFGIGVLQAVSGIMRHRFAVTNWLTAAYRVVQLTAGFLLTLPFQQRFANLTELQRDAYLGLVVLAAVITALVLSPVAIHRRLSGEQVKDRLVAASHVIMRTVLVLMGLLVAGIVAFIFDVVIDRTSAFVAGAALLLLLVTMLGIVPRALVHK